MFSALYQDDLLNKIYLLFCVPLENSKYGHVTESQSVLMKLYDAALHKAENEEDSDLITESSVELLCKLLASLVNLGAENAIINSSSSETKQYEIQTIHFFLFFQQRSSP